MAVMYFEKVDFGRIIRLPHQREVDIGLYQCGTLVAPFLDDLNISLLEGPLQIVPENLVVGRYRHFKGSPVKASSKVSLKRVYYTPETVVIECPGVVSLGKHMLDREKKVSFSVDATHVKNFCEGRIHHRTPERLLSIHTSGDDSFCGLDLYPNLRTLSVHHKLYFKTKHVVSHPNLWMFTLKTRALSHQSSRVVEIRDCPKLKRLEITGQACILKNLSLDVLSVSRRWEEPRFSVRLVNCFINNLYIKGETPDIESESSFCEWAFVSDEESVRHARNHLPFVGEVCVRSS